MKKEKNIQEAIRKPRGIKRFLCSIIGHKPAEFTDNGYEVCARCDAHSYYDHPRYYRRSGYLAKALYWTKWRTCKIVCGLKHWNYKRKNGELPF